MADEFTGFATAQTSKSEFATLMFLAQQAISQIATVALVRVVACTNDGGLTPVGTVDVQPLVDQITGDRQTFPHGTIFKLPYLRMQGGVNAVILDPQPGDIGMCGFCSRDISALKADPAAALARAPVPGAPPGSFRQYAWSDGLYLGGYLNGLPEQYVRFSAEGMELVSPTRIRLSAPVIEIAADTSVTVDSPANDIKGGATKIDGKPFLTHTHSGVVAGGANSGPVTP